MELYSLKFNNIFLYYLCSIIGSLIILILSNHILKYKITNFIQYMGKRSFIIIGTHMIFISILNFIMDKIDIIPMVIEVIITPFIIIVFEYLFLKTIDKFKCKLK